MTMSIVLNPSPSAKESVVGPVYEKSAAEAVPAVTVTPTLAGASPPNRATGTEITRVPASPSPTLGWRSRNSKLPWLEGEGAV